MSARTASIGYHGHELHYAEVVHTPTPRLVRLGSCEFDFNIDTALAGLPESSHLSAMADALAEIFSDTEATQLHIALHPPACTSFFAPFSVDIPTAERDQHILYEVEQLGAFDAAYPPLVLHEPVRQETVDQHTVDWHHILRVDWNLASKIDRLTASLPPTNHQYLTSTRGVMTLLARLARLEATASDARTPYTLSIGAYNTHVEYILSRNDTWVFSCFSESGLSSDSPYFLVSMLKRLDVAPRRVGRLYFYGPVSDTEHFKPFEHLFVAQPTFINPMQAFQTDPSVPLPSVSAAYGPCIGAALTTHAMTII